ncbi:MAG TPA: glycosyltransferase family 2 protein [Nitrospirota bacterium]|nr:glycosyltransferase family 2 protein [Nitrospirota bacterium]
MNKNSNALPTIDILLATYNGEQFLDDQIQSILNQTYPYWRLIIRDDGSTDNTNAIIHSYAVKYPDKIFIIKSSERTMGACENFNILLEHVISDYVMFCDQDDVWLPQKIERTFQKICDMEKIYGRNMPLLVYTDLKVADANLHIITNSYWRYEAINPNIGKSFSRLLTTNVMTGCTIMINRKLKEMATPIPQEAMMHDWWIGLVSSAFGKNDYLNEATILHRLHTSNVVGAKRYKRTKIFDELIRLFRLKRIYRHNILRTQPQAAEFASRYKSFLNDNDYKKITIYSKLSDQSFYKRLAIIRHGFWKSGLPRWFAML